MEVIKITDLDASLLEEGADSIDESTIDSQYQEVQKILSSTNESTTFNQAIRESSADFLAAGALGGLALIAFIRNYLKKKYTIKAKKILDQSKELNDIYTKVVDIISHDRMARFKHRNDKITVTIRTVLLQNSVDGKYYNIVIDQLIYDIDWFTNTVRAMMDYLDNHPATNDAAESEALDKWADAIIESLAKGFKERHWYTETCTPIIKNEVYNGLKLERAIKLYKDSFSNLYEIVYSINRFVTNQMTCLQFFEKSYKSCMTAYGTTKARKEAIDKIFKYALKNSTSSIDFNNKIMDAFTEKIHYYVEELEKIYDMLRQ